MPPEAPVTMATLLVWVVMIVLLGVGHRSSAPDGDNMPIPMARIIMHLSTSSFESSNNGPLRRHARLHPHRGTTQFHPGRRRSWPAALLGHRCREGTGGAVGGTAVAAHDAAGQSDPGWRGLLSALCEPDRGYGGRGRCLRRRQAVGVGSC